MDSVHVPGRVARGVLHVGKLSLPIIGAGMLWLGRAGFGWFESRVSREYVATRIAHVESIVVATKGPAFHGSTMADEHQRQLTFMWSRLVELEAELMVYRQYGKVELQRRNRLVTEARNFYAAEFDEQLKRHGNNLAEAAQAALRVNWRPTQ